MTLKFVKEFPCNCSQRPLDISPILCKMAEFVDSEGGQSDGVCVSGANSSTLPPEVEPKGATFHHNGFLMYPATKIKTHALNFMLRFKPSVQTAIIIDR